VEEARNDKTRLKQKYREKAKAARRRLLRQQMKTAERRGEGDGRGRDGGGKNCRKSRRNFRVT